MAAEVASAIQELGIDIVKVARIRDTLGRFGARFSERVLTPGERRYVRDRPETLAGRWAAKEAVSKVLGLGVRGIGWREIEIERLPTGQPAVRLHGRAAARARQLGMGRIALSISHEADYAVAIAFGLRTVGGRFLFPPDIEERLDDRERRVLARMERLRALAEREAADRDGDDRQSPREPGVASEDDSERRAAGAGREAASEDDSERRAAGAGREAASEDDSGQRAAGAGREAADENRASGANA